MKKAIAFLLSALLLCAAAGCASESKEKASSQTDAVSNTETTDAPSPEATAVSVAYTFSADGKTTCTYGEASVEGTYTFDGTKLQTTFEGSAPLFEYSAEKDILVSADEATGITTVLGRVND